MIGEDIVELGGYTSGVSRGDIARLSSATSNAEANSSRVISGVQWIVAVWRPKACAAIWVVN